jgi:hypothetical protein
MLCNLLDPTPFNLKELLKRLYKNKNSCHNTHFLFKHMDHEIALKFEGELDCNKLNSISSRHICGLLTIT